MKYNIIGFLLLLLLSGCEETSDPFSNSDVAHTGRFIDSPVNGMLYGCDEGLSGTTGENGSFHYAEDCLMTFSVGSIVLGSAPAGSLVTPLDFVPGSEDEKHPQVINRVRFLMTLDADHTPENGISISHKVHSISQGIAVNFEQSIAEFESDPNVLSIVAELSAINAEVTGLVTVEEAQLHFRTSLLSLLSGGYTGYVTGDIEGWWRLTVNLDGKVRVGALFSDDLADSLELSGTVESNGRFDIRGLAGYKQFTGRIGLDGQVVGEWLFPGLDLSGAMSGVKIASSEKPPEGNTGSGSASVPGVGSGGGSFIGGTLPYAIEAVNEEIGVASFGAAAAIRIVNYEFVTGQTSQEEKALMIETWIWRPTDFNIISLERYTSTQYPEKNKLVMKYIHSPPKTRRKYKFELECGINNRAECGAIAFNDADKEVSFSLLRVLPLSDPKNWAKTSVILDGTLGWIERDR